MHTRSGVPETFFAILCPFWARVFAKYFKRSSCRADSRTGGSARQGHLDGKGSLMFYSHRVSRYSPRNSREVRRILAQLLEERDKVDDLIRALQQASEQGEQTLDAVLAPRSKGEGTEPLRLLQGSVNRQYPI